MNRFEKEVPYPTIKKFGDLSAGDAFYSIDESSGRYGIYLKVFDKDIGRGNDKDGAFFALNLMKWTRIVENDDHIVYPVDLRTEIVAKFGSPWNNYNTALPSLITDCEGWFIYAEDGSDDYHLFGVTNNYHTGNIYVDMMTGQLYHQNHFPNVIFVVDANMIVSMSGDGDTK